MIIAITGASGVGKTSALKELSRDSLESETFKVYHFDDMDLPNWDELEDLKKWQKEATIGWIDKIVAIARKENIHILFEGSTEIKFYIQGFEKNDYQNYKILLFDCSEEIMKNRLFQRGQPELYHSNMIGWLHYLRNEALERNIEIVETGKLTISKIGHKILEELNL